MKGYNEMLRRIEPSKIICYSKPFPEMQGDIIYIDYELSGWKYLKNQANVLNDKIKNGIIIHKIMVQPDDILKGTGSAYGGKWIPKKPDDERYLGKPGEIKVTFDKNGERRLTKIGDDGRAEIERHESFHNRADKHTNPHDHIISWDNPMGHPDPQPPINYPNGAPEFKSYKGLKIQMIENKNKEYRFKTISEFRWCMRFHGEVEFRWKGKSYSITHPEGRINIGEGCYEKDGKYYNVNSHAEYSPNNEMWGDTADEILEYNVGGDRLRDVITQVEIIDRTI